jgi:DNA-binding NtrC family response regulator
VEFIAKPCEPDALKALLAKARTVTEFEQSAAGTETGIVGSGFAIRKLHEQIAQYAAAPFPVLIEGESGSGRTGAIAAPAERAGAKSCANCAAISPCSRALTVRV